MVRSILAICCGASVGALARWGLGNLLNPIYPLLPLGTLTANLVGGFIIGFAMSFFSTVNLPPEWRLLVITGFLGALTTFSTFSAEVVTLLQHQRYGAAGIAVTAHLAGSLIMTIFGMACFSAIRHYILER